MYLPPAFTEPREDVLHEFIRARGLGTLVTLSAGRLTADHLPFYFDPASGPYGTLRAHVARANPVWRDASPDLEALVVFDGPQAYVTPNWYVTKQESGKVVPTFNYVAVHAYGPLRIIDDPAWLRSLVERLTDRFEARQARPWKVADAPDDFIRAQLQAVVGIEIPIQRLMGKWKVSQNRSVPDREGVIHGLQAIGGADALTIAEEVAKRRPSKV